MSPSLSSTGWWEVEGIGGRTDLREKLVSGTQSWVGLLDGIRHESGCFTWGHQVQVPSSSWRLWWDICRSRSKSNGLGWFSRGDTLSAVTEDLCIGCSPVMLAVSPSGSFMGCIGLDHLRSGILAPKKGCNDSLSSLLFSNNSFCLSIPVRHPLGLFSVWKRYLFCFFSYLLFACKCLCWSEVLPEHC